jgi:hypothetical protein
MQICQTAQQQHQKGQRRLLLQARMHLEGVLGVALLLMEVT